MLALTILLLAIAAIICILLARVEDDEIDRGGR